MRDQAKGRQSVIMTNWFELRLLRLGVMRHLLTIARDKTGSRLEAFRLLQSIRKKYRTTFGSGMLAKASKVSGRYFWRFGSPGYPSQAINNLHSAELGRFIPGDGSRGLRTVFMAITKKCTMQCRHCFEWDNLNGSERLSMDDLVSIVHKFQDYGTAQVMLSGGEPLLRLDAVFGVLAAARPGTDFWIITSGLGLDAGVAKKLKDAGLTGVMVSLDHFEEQPNDRFRGYRGAWQAAVNAARAAGEAGLVVTLALCVNGEMTQEKNVRAYIDLAKDLNVTFVQLIEPRATGRFRKSDVVFGEQEINLLERLYLEYNSGMKYRHYPILNYLGYHQRRVGCFGGGNRFLYVDADGDAHLCPYCRGKIASTLDRTCEEVIEALAEGSCHAFEPALPEPVLT